MVEQVVYFVLGFVICGLIGLAFLPLVSARARRLTLARIESRLPMTFDEIEADRDLLRARFAVENRALEVKAEEARHGRVAEAAELGRRAVAVMRVTEQLEQTNAKLDERNAELAKAREYGEKLLADLNQSHEKLARAQEESAKLLADLGKLTEERQRQEDRVKELTAELAEAERRCADFDARRTRMLAKIAAERKRSEELENKNLDLRRQFVAQLPAAGEGEAGVNGALANAISPEQELLDLREAISRLGRQVARMDSTDE